MKRMNLDCVWGHMELIESRPKPTWLCRTGRIGQGSKHCYVSADSDPEAAVLDDDLWMLANVAMSRFGQELVYVDPSRIYPVNR